MPTAYLDHAASTPMRPEALAAMTEVLAAVPGNPSGQHGWARGARRRLDDARDLVAAAVGARPSEVVFTSGGTEADNLAIVGAARARAGVAACFETDHHAAIEPARAGGGVALSAHGRGRLDPERVAADLGRFEAVAVVSICAVNNELGVVQPVAELAEAARRGAPGALVHVDAVAAAGWADLEAIWEVADLMSLSGHKVGGPKGIGALVVREGTALEPTSLGGSQERERRAGTPNVAGAVGFGVALERTIQDRPDRAARVAAMRDRLRAGVLGRAAGRAVDLLEGEAVELAPHVLHLCARGVHREALLLRLDADGVAASAGSSCASGAPQRSHVVEALCVPVGLREGALRLSLGWSTTEEEIDHALAVVPEAICDLAGTAPEEPEP